MPSISVVMPVFNSASFLKESMESILSQSFSDFEFLIFNDGSTDGSLELIKSYHDERVRLFHNEINQGYVKLLNIGLAEARGEFIARMDSDDIADPNRLEKQFQFLKSNSDYVLCGSNYTILGSSHSSDLPTSDEEIKLKMLSITPFCHPSVMIRTSSLRDNNLSYIPEHIPAEDHELWVRLSRYGKFCNLKESLLVYRLHENNISLKPRTQAQQQNLVDAQKLYISNFFSKVQFRENEVNLLHQLFFKDSGYDVNNLGAIGELVTRLALGNFEYPIVNKKKVADFLRQKFFYRCTTSTHLGLPALSLALQTAKQSVSLIDYLKLLIKALFKYSPA